MKKVININFQGQVIPIEETAYEQLQAYVASLRTYFANEEGRDEIINDIESRIAELFAEQLKKGAACITDAEVNRIMDSMGRPADFAAADEAEAPGTDAGSSRQSSQQSTASPGANPFEPKRLYRDEQDKFVAGVASGIAHYLNVDPAIIRLIFVLLTIFGGSGLLVYIIFWIVLPSRSLVTNIRKRLYRDADDRVVAGVGGGLAKYFDINPAIPRLIFAAPFILGIISSVFSSMFYTPFPGLVGGFGGGTFILAYIILWIVLPVARTASEKLEMRGEKVDLNSIRNTIANDLDGLRTKAQQAGKELSATAQEATRNLQETIRTKQAQLGSDVGQFSQRSSSGLGRALGILVKAFVYFIVGIVVFSLFVTIIALMVAGVSVFPLHDYLLQGVWQHFAAWGTLILFLGVPMVALIVWLIRRIMGVKKHNPYLGYGFGTLWTIGLICCIFLIATLNRSFSTQVGVRQEVALQQPVGNTLLLTRAPEDVVFYNGLLNISDVVSVSRDTLQLNTVMVKLEKSKDGAFHAYMIKQSRGRDNDDAQLKAENTRFDITQQDSTLYLGPTMKVSRKDKWRNQKVVVVIEVPAGKNVVLDESIDDFSYFDLQPQRRNRRGNQWEYRFETPTWRYEKNVPLQMTPEGLEPSPDRRSNEYRYRDEEAAPVPNGSEKADTVVNTGAYRYSLLDAPAVPAMPKGAILGNALTTMLRM